MDVALHLLLSNQGQTTGEVTVENGDKVKISAHLNHGEKFNLVSARVAFSQSSGLTISVPISMLTWAFDDSAVDIVISYCDEQLASLGEDKGEALSRLLGACRVATAVIAASLQ